MQHALERLRRDDHAHVRADQLLAGVAEHVRELLAHVEIDAVLADADALEGCLGEQAEALLARTQRVLQPAPFRDVGDDALERDRLAAVVAHGAHAQQAGADLAVRAAEVDGGAAQRALLRERRDDLLDGDAARMPVGEMRAVRRARPRSRSRASIASA